MSQILGAEITGDFGNDPMTKCRSGVADANADAFSLDFALKLLDVWKRSCN